MIYPFDTARIIDICRQNDVSFVGLFGSFARGENTENSDIDLLVKFSSRKSLLALVRLERELTLALSRKVDVLTDASISPYIRANILHDLKVIYEKS
jgi:predicted nucleotidyltransferase